MSKYSDLIILMLLPVPLVGIGLMLVFILAVAKSDTLTRQHGGDGQAEILPRPTHPLSEQAALIATVNAAPTRELDFRVANAENGELLFNTFQAAAGFACATCHLPDSEVQLIGPGLLNVGQRAETRVAEQDAETYLRTSIVTPSAYVVEGFPDNLMPQNWGQIYSDSQINDLIAYLMTLEGEVADETASTVSSATDSFPALTDMALGDGNAERGQVLFNTFQPEAGFACATCHFPDTEDRLIGPGLLHVGTRAETRVAGQSGLQYLYTSITNPDAYIVDSFPDSLMPENWAEIYTTEDIRDIMAYLLTLE